MNIRIKSTPSEKGRITLQALRVAVGNALEKKCKLNQYAVVWDGKRPVQKRDNFEEVTHW